MRKSSWLLLLLLCVLPSRVMAQTTPPPDDAKKHWGVAASFSPVWKGNLTLQQKLFWTDPEDDDPQLLEGSEFTFGVVRGTTAGGDWGVNYVRKPIKNYTNTVTEDFGTFCFGPVNNQTCQTDTYAATTTTNSVLVEGVEVHVFIPVVRFAKRIQMGVGVGGGIGFSSGTTFTSSTQTSVITQPGKPPVTNIFNDEFESDAAGDVIGVVVPLAKVEFQTAILVARGLKVNVAVGMNLPSAINFRIGMAYFFGAR